MGTGTPEDKRDRVLDEARSASARCHAGATAHFPIVAVGASAGGLEAFEQFLGAIPGCTGIAFVLIQHLDPSRPSVLADLLARETPMPVEQARDGVVIEPDHVYVVPPDKDLSIRDRTLHLVPRRLEHGIHLPIDRFFDALARDVQDAALAVVLSGTGSDGVYGLSAIRAAGGMTFVQTPESASFGGMPQAALDADVADVTGSARQIAWELVRLCRQGLVSPEGTGSSRPAGRADEADAIPQIVSLLWNETGVDFSGYKESMVRRRIERRILLRRYDSLDAYLQHVRENRDELRALYKDLLISVTRFFRDGEVFDLVGSRVLPELLSARPAGRPLRMWVPGCSTGEEVYSLLMTTIGAIEAAGRDTAVTVFGTDINEESLAHARTGVYPRSVRADIGPERLARFFTPCQGGYEVIRSVRKMCVFARQDVTCDPPLSRMDLISLRNVLIYMDPETQRLILVSLHKAMAPGGVLVLGSSEAIRSDSTLFEPIDARRKVFRCLETHSSPTDASRSPRL